MLASHRVSEPGGGIIVSIVHRTAAGGSRRAALALASAVLLLVALVAPAWAVSGPTRLLDPDVPAAGRSDQSIVVSVTYRNREGSAPDHVHAIVDGTPRAMRAQGSDWKKGVRFTLGLSLSPGSHRVSFEAADTGKFSDAIEGGTIAVAAPPAAATPAPTPRPSPKPTPRPTPAPTPRATAEASPEPAGGVPTAPTAATGQPFEPEPNLQPSVLAPALPEPGSDEGSAFTPRPTAVAVAGGLRSGAASRPPVERDLAGLGLGSEPSWERLLPTLVVTTGAVTMAMAFALFGKRRRNDDDPDDEALAAAAAAGAGGGAATLVPPAPADPEAGLPRWRRPSLLEARKNDPLRTASVAVKLSFDHGVVGPVAGLERRLIRYRLVRLLDAPDEVRGAEIGTLDQDDEVQLVERSGAYWQILCPDGRQGWVHKMTLGEVVTGRSTAVEDATGVNAGVADEEEIDEDVLSAFLASRAQRD